MSLQNKIILGLDPGFADTGYGVIQKEGNSLKFIATGSIQTPKSQQFVDRLVDIHAKIQKLIEEHRPELVAIEKLYFSKNVRTALDVGQARGVALLAISQAKLPILELSPSQIKQALTSSGNAPKQQVGQMVKMLLKLKEIPKPDDAADALAIAIAASFTNQTLLK